MKFDVMAFVFPNHHDVWWDPALLEITEHCLPMGSRKLIPYFALLLCVAFVLPVKLSSSQLPDSLACTHLILSPICLCRSERVAAWGLAAGCSYTTTSSKAGRKSKSELVVVQKSKEKDRSSLLPKFICSEDNGTSTCS